MFYKLLILIFIIEMFQTVDSLWQKIQQVFISKNIFVNNSQDDNSGIHNKIKQEWFKIISQNKILSAISKIKSLDLEPVDEQVDKIQQFKVLVSQLLTQQNYIIQTDSIEKQYEEIHQDYQKKANFNVSEKEGRILDFQQIYNFYINNKKLCSYVELPNYFFFVRDFFNLFEIELEIKEKEFPLFNKFYKIIIEYLESYIQKSQPNINIQLYKEKILNQYLQENQITFEQKDYYTIETFVDSYCCNLCQKKFVLMKNFQQHSCFVQNPNQQYQLQKIKQISKNLTINLLEKYITEYLMLLETQFEQTIEYLRQKDTQNILVSESSESEQEQNKSEKIKKNIKHKQLPIGWDGKPIPHWLYKLHGMDLKFKCEICGDFIYEGRKPFTSHFSQQRHTQGLMQIGIIYNDSYKYITFVKDALQLQKRLNKNNSQFNFNEQEIQQIEDAQGNIFSKSDYELLQKEKLV